jgi:hypothetical protein
MTTTLSPTPESSDLPCSPNSPDYLQLLAEHFPQLAPALAQEPGTTALGSILSHCVCKARTAPIPLSVRVALEEIDSNPTEYFEKPRFLAARNTILAQNILLGAPNHAPNHTIVPDTAPRTIILVGDYQLCNDCGAVLCNGERCETFFDWDVWLRRYVHSFCRVGKRHEILGIVRKDGSVYGTKLTTLTVDFDSEDGEVLKGDIKAEVEVAATDYCYERLMPEKYDQERQSKLAPSPVWGVNPLTGDRTPERICKRCKAPMGKRRGTIFCSDNCRKRYHEETTRK